MRFRVSDEECVAIRAAATRSGLAYGAFIVRVVLTAIREDCPVDGVLAEFHSDLKNLSRQLNGVGVNLNQLARVANTTGEVPGNVPYVAGYCFRVVRAAEALVVEVGRWLP
jgi:Mobilization protein NikA